MPRFFFAALFEATDSATIGHIAGVLGFVLVADALYTAWALLLEYIRNKTALPVGRSGPALAVLGGRSSTSSSGSSTAPA